MSMPYPSPQATHNDRKGLAIASLIIGLISFITLSGLLIGALLSIILGVVALIKASKNRVGGKGMAIAGIVISLCSIPCTAIIMAIAIPNFIASRNSANMASTVETMRLLYSTEIAYYSTLGNGNYASAEELFKEDLLDARIANALDLPAMTSKQGKVCAGTREAKSGYKFILVAIPATTEKDSSFTVTAIAVSKTGKIRNFFIDESAVIRVSENATQIPDANSARLK